MSLNYPPNRFAPCLDLTHSRSLNKSNCLVWALASWDSLHQVPLFRCQPSICCPHSHHGTFGDPLNWFEFFMLLPSASHVPRTVPGRVHKEDAIPTFVTSPSWEPAHRIIRQISAEHLPCPTPCARLRDLTHLSKII